MDEEKYIELNTFLKINSIAPTGGQVKLIIRSGIVKVNGIIETRNKRKLHLGDTVELENKKLKVDNIR